STVTTAAPAPPPPPPTATTTRPTAPSTTATTRAPARPAPPKAPPVTTATTAGRRAAATHNGDRHDGPAAAHDGDDRRGVGDHHRRQPRVHRLLRARGLRVRPGPAHLPGPPDHRRRRAADTEQPCQVGADQHPGNADPPAGGPRRPERPDRHGLGSDSDERGLRPVHPGHPRPGLEVAVGRTPLGPQGVRRFCACPGASKRSSVQWAARGTREPARPIPTASAATITATRRPRRRPVGSSARVRISRQVARAASRTCPRTWTVIVTNHRMKLAWWTLRNTSR